MNVEKITQFFNSAVGANSEAGSGIQSVKERMTQLKANKGCNPLMWGEFKLPSSRPTKPVPLAVETNPVNLTWVSSMNSATVGTIPPPTLTHHVPVQGGKVNGPATPAKPFCTVKPVQDGKVNGPPTPVKPFPVLKPPSVPAKYGSSSGLGSGNQDIPIPSFHYKPIEEQLGGRVRPVVPRKPSLEAERATPLLCASSSHFANNIHELAKEFNSEVNQKSCQNVFQSADGKKFRKIDVASVLPLDFPAPKPIPVGDVDLTLIIKAYEAATGKRLSVSSNVLPSGIAGQVDELYTDAGSDGSVVETRTRWSVHRPASSRISLIPVLTEQEEQQELYTDSQSDPSAETVFNMEKEGNNCSSAMQQQQQQTTQVEEQDEIYEPLDDDLDSKPFPPLPSAVLAEDKKAKKEKEKEKIRDKSLKKKDKAKEEAHKKEEKERKKREEVKKQRCKFGLSDTDGKVGEGVVKNNSGSGVFKKDLSVSKGEIITILRMDNNPTGKWLVQNEQGKLGYVHANNIERAIAIQNMVYPGMVPNSEDHVESEDVYEAMPEGEMEDIYEDV